MRKIPVVIVHELHHALFLHVHLTIGAHLEILRIHAGLMFGALRSALAFLDIVQEVLPIRIQLLLPEPRFRIDPPFWKQKIVERDFVAGKGVWNREKGAVFSFDVRVARGL